MKTRLPLSRLPTSERSSRRAEKVSAWVLHGGDVSQWIEACIELGLDQNKLRIFPVRMDGVEQAVLLDGSKSSNTSASTVHAKPLHRLFDRLWIPYDAEPALPLFTEDVADMLVADFAILLPDNKIVHFSLKHGLKMMELLQPPELNQRSWRSGREGKEVGFFLKSIHTLNPASVDDFLNESKGDIGSQEIKKIDVPDKSAGMLEKLFYKGKKGSEKIPGGKMINGLGKGVATASLGTMFLGLKGIGMGLNAIGSVFPASNQQHYEPDMLDKLTEWTGEKIAKLRDSQSREIEKLIEKLKTNPDLGLQYALPLNGGDGRGVADASSSLSRENLNFDLSTLRSGGAFSPWDLDAEHHHQLVNLYRENANREVTLGRHRRAAYIYAHLLDDLNSAADVLVQGGYFQEAAALYEKLGNKKQQAECWEKAGEIEKAVALYEELNDYPKIADLYTRLGRPDDAERVWRDYIAKLLKDDDPLKATALMIEKFDESEEAIACLSNYWHHSNQATACLEQEMKYRERYQRAEPYEERLFQLMNPDQRALTNDKLLKVFDSLREWTAIPKYRENLENALKVVVSSILLDPNKSSSAALKCLKDLEHQDEIIGHDVKRYIRNERVTRFRHQIEIHEKKEEILTVTKVLYSDNEAWRVFDVIKTRAGMLVLFRTKEYVRVLCIRFLDDGNSDKQMLSWRSDYDIPMNGRLSSVEQNNEINVMISPLSGEFRRFNPNARFDSKANENLKVHWRESSPVLAACLAPNGAMYEIIEQNGVECYLRFKLNGQTKTFHLAALPETADLSEENIQFLIQATDHCVFFMVGSLFGVFSNETVEWIGEVYLPTRLRVSPLNPKCAIVVDSDCLLLCYDGRILRIENNSIKDACLLDRNTIAVLSKESAIMIYRINENEEDLEKIAEHQITSLGFEMIMNGKTTRSVILLTTHQTMQVMEFVLPSW